MKIPTAEEATREADIRRQWVWEDSGKASTPVGKLFYEFYLCRFFPHPLDAFEAKRKEVQRMLLDAEILIMEVEIQRDKREKKDEE